MNIHEELLAKIEERHWKLFNFNYQDQSLDAIEFRKAVLKNTQALRAVVELHKPVKDEWIDYTTCHACRVADDDYYSPEYPCLTIQAIEKELG